MHELRNKIAEVIRRSNETGTGKVVTALDKADRILAIPEIAEPIKVREMMLDTRWQENERMRDLLTEADSILTNSGAESGYCMCGEPVAGHTIGSGHSPVDSHVYHATALVDKIRQVLKG